MQRAVTHAALPDHSSGPEIDHFFRALAWSFLLHAGAVMLWGYAGSGASADARVLALPKLAALHGRLTAPADSPSAAAYQQMPLPRSMEHPVEHQAPEPRPAPHWMPNAERDSASIAPAQEGLLVNSDWLLTEHYYSSREVDQSAAALNEPILAYPQAALESRLGGHVVVRIFIAKDGSVKHAEVVRAAPVGTFESAALEAVLRLIFRPALLHGDPVPSRITIEVPFDPYCERPGVCSHRVGTHGLISR